MLRNLLSIALMLTIHANALAEDTLPESVRREFNSYVGVWEGSVDFGGEETPVKWTASWAPGNQCLVIHEEYIVGGEPSKITALMAYDRIKKRVVNIGFRTDGGNRTLTYADDYESGKATGDSPDGKLFNSNFKIEKSDAEWAVKFEVTSPDTEDFVIRLRKQKSK